MSTSTTAAQLLRSALAAEPARPFLTFYDDATGERVELSLATFENWVAKTANLLQDDLDLSSGGTVALLLPLHWQVPVWTMATWLLGAAVLLEPSDSDLRDVDAVVTGPDTLDRALASGAEVVHLSLRPALAAATAPALALPPSVLDADTDVLGHGDRFAAHEPAQPEDLALTAGAEVFDGAELTAYALGLAAGWEAGPGVRLLTTLPPVDAAGLCAAFVTPLALGGSAVLVAHARAGGLAAKQTSERVTAVAGRLTEA